MDQETPYSDYNVKPKNPSSGKHTHLLDNHPVLIALVAGAILLIGLYVCAWYLGYARATVKAQSTVAQLRIENTQLSNEAASWKRKALSSGLVTAEEAMEILLADYAADSTVVTLEYPFSDCAMFTDSQKISDWEVPFTEKAFTMKWNGTISAGIDLEKVSIKTGNSGETLIVTIPQAKVLSTEIDKESFELLDEKNNLFNPISLEDMYLLEAKVEEMMQNRAVDNGLLETAQQNARVLITDILRSSPDIGSYYELEFKLK